MICVDGGKGLLAARHTFNPGKPAQRCWAQTETSPTRCAKGDRGEIRDNPRDIGNSDTEKSAKPATDGFKQRGKADDSKAIRTLNKELDQLTTGRYSKTFKKPKRCARQTSSKSGSGKSDITLGPVSLPCLAPGPHISGSLPRHDLCPPK